MSPRPTGRPRISDEELLEDIRRVAADLGHAPTATEMRTHGRYSVATYRNHFGRWSRALQEAGFEARN